MGGFLCASIRSLYRLCPLGPLVLVIYSKIDALPVRGGVGPHHLLPFLESVYWEPQPLFYFPICTICTIYFLFPSSVYIMYCATSCG
jgi:hypothetical protein